MFLQSWSSILYARPLQLQEPGPNYICYRSPADIRFSWPVKTSRWSRWVQEVDLQVLLHSVNLLNNTNLPLLIVSACDILVQTQGLCGNPTKTCLSGNVKWTYKYIIFCCTFICVGIYWFEEMVTFCSWYSLTQGKSFFSTQVKLLSVFPLKYNKTVCQGCLSYKKPALTIHPKFSQMKLKLRQCQNRLCVCTNLTCSCSFAHP